MNVNERQSKGKRGFTIVELLTVMSVIIILMGLLLPALNMAKRYAKRVKQKNQFAGINAALEMFNVEQEGYPESSALNVAPNITTGAHRLTEALIGRDFQGFDTLSSWDAKADESDTAIYGTNPTNPVEVAESLDRRKGPYLELDQLGAFQIGQLYPGNATVYNGLTTSAPVITDVYTITRVTIGSKVVKAGTPILYYKANVSSDIFDTSPTANLADNIYNPEDNDDLVQLGHIKHPTPTDPLHKHHFDSTYTDPASGQTGTQIFYEAITNPRIPLIGGYGRPYQQESFILVSAGFDGRFGTRDDVFNFGN